METNRCIINRVQASDYEDIKKLYMNERVREFLGGPVSNEKYDESFKAIMSAEAGDFYWVARARGTNEFIGLVSLDTHHDGVNKELSYQFIPEYWGKGYGREVLNHLISYIFEVLKFHKIVAETQAANIASCKLLERLEMKIEGIVNRFGVEQRIFSIERN